MDCVLCYVPTHTHRPYCSLFHPVYRAFKPSYSALIVHSAAWTTSFPLDRCVQTRVEYISRTCILYSQCKMAEEPLWSIQVTPPPVTSIFGHLALPSLHHVWLLSLSMTYQYMHYQADRRVPQQFPVENNEEFDGACNAVTTVLRSTSSRPWVNPMHLFSTIHLLSLNCLVGYHD